MDVSSAGMTVTVVIVAFLTLVAFKDGIIQTIRHPASLLVGLTVLALAFVAALLFAQAIGGS